MIVSKLSKKENKNSAMSRAKKILIFVTILDILALCGVAFAYYTHINSMLELKKTKVNVEF